MKKKYELWQKIWAAYNNMSPEWYYATNLEKAIMTFNNLSDEEKRDFIIEISKTIKL
jgi:hypothetical protein